MNHSELKQRLGKDRPMTMVSLRMPADVISDLKQVAPHLGFSGYQPLMRAYIGQGLRTDLAKLEHSTVIDKLLENLRQKGVSEELLASAIADVTPA